MNILKAAQRTANVAHLQRRNWRDAVCPELSYDHIIEMNMEMQSGQTIMSDTKLCRWLGWMQATVVAQTYPYTDLSVMKLINKECADDPTVRPEKSA